MMRSSHGGISSASSPQSKAPWSYTTALPTELVTWRAYGSMRERSPSGVRIVSLYSAPASTPSTSADQLPPDPSPSRPRAVAVIAHSSNVPVTNTASACGAQTRNIVPPSYGTAPIPGRGEGDAVIDDIGGERTRADLHSALRFRGDRVWHARRSDEMGRDAVARRA